MSNSQSKFEFNPQHETVFTPSLRDMVLSNLPPQNEAYVVSSKFQFGPTILEFERENFGDQDPMLYVDIIEQYGKDSLTRSCTIDERTGQVISHTLSNPIPNIHSLEDLAFVHVDKPYDEIFVPLAADIEATITQEKIDAIEFEVRALTQPTS
jgi:hypothetical protein